METNIIINGNSLDELKKLPAESINCCVTSPPYWGLRSYGKERLKPYLEQDKLTNKIEVISSEKKPDVITTI